MWREDRRIIFDYHETYQAICALCGQRQMPRPWGAAIEAVSVKAGDGKSVVVTFANAGPGKPPMAEYSWDFLAAALILHCRNSAIPIPKRAAKSVELDAQSVTLHMTM